MRIRYPNYNDFLELHYSDTDRMEEEALGHQRRLDEIRLRTPIWITEEHRKRFKCTRCGRPLGFGNAEYKDDKPYHPGCVNPLNKEEK